MSERWAAFTYVERAAIRDGLVGESEIDPNEDPTFPERIAKADRMIAEIDSFEGRA
jgi:hypothetical protein